MVLFTERGVLFNKNVPSPSLDAVAMLDPGNLGPSYGLTAGDIY